MWKKPTDDKVIVGTCRRLEEEDDVRTREGQ